MEHVIKLCKIPGNYRNSSIKSLPVFLKEFWITYKIFKLVKEPSQRYLKVKQIRKETKRNEVCECSLP